MSKTKDTIEGLKEISESMQINYNLIMGKKFPRKVYGEYPEKHNKDLEALSHAITVLTAQEQAEGILKKKKLKMVTPSEDGARQENACIEPYNEAISIATPILAKKILEIEKLKKAICPDGSITDVNELVDFSIDLQDAYEQLSNIEEKDKELKDLKAYCEIEANKQHKKLLKVIEELQSLKSKLTVDKLVKIQINMGHGLPSSEQERKYKEVAQALIKELGVEV